MKIIQKVIGFRLVINLPVGLALVAVASFVLNLLLFALQGNPFSQILTCISQSGYRILWLNWLPLLFIMLLLYFLCGHIVWACGLTGFAAILLAVINRNMISLRQAPFQVYDILLGGEFMGIAKSIDHKLFFILLLGMIAFALFFALCLYFIRNKKMNPSVRAVCVLILAVGLYFGNRTVYTDKALYEGLYMEGNFYNQTDNFESKGFLYSFIYSFNTNKIVKPSGYDKREIEEAIDSFQSKDLSGVTKPNIILILSEGFSELPMSSHLNFDNYEDPMHHYKQIKEKSVGGYIVVPNIGGGTADTEFDIFTGVSTRQFRGTPYAYNLIARPFSALPSFLQALGYENLAIHPGYTWFYNRKNVYPYMGFTDFIGLDNFDKKDNKGMYISEAATFDKLIADYERHVGQSEDPFFEFGLTIQNHGPYKGKYGADVNFSSDISFTPDEIDMLSNYFEGMLDCDRELNRLVSFADSRPEPLVIIYYGDHLPSFPSNIYDQLIPGLGADDQESRIRLHKLPFLIYQNQAAKKMTPLEQSLPAQSGLTVSSNYLGAMVMELLGFEGVDPFFDYLNRLRKKYPILLEEQYFDESQALHTLNPDEDHEIHFYQKWSYFKIFDAIVPERYPAAP